MPLKAQLLAIGLAITCIPVSYAQERQDRFIGMLTLEDVDPTGGRKFRLGQDLTYVDPDGARWYARKGLVFDGASIPQILWSIVGSPYTGLYRRAAVIHDWYCTNLYRPWPDVHRAFYNAMITDGVNSLKAKLMYYAVVRFGPRWTVAEQKSCPPHMSCADSITLRVDINKVTTEEAAIDPDALRSELMEVAAILEKNDPTPDGVAALAMQKPPPPAKAENRILTGNEAIDFGENRR